MTQTQTSLFMLDVPGEHPVDFEVDGPAPVTCEDYAQQAHARDEAIAAILADLGYTPESWDCYHIITRPL